MQKSLLFIFSLLLLFSSKAIAQDFIPVDTLGMEEVTLNGKNLYQDYRSFMKESQVDSTKREVWECGSPFDWMDQAYMQTHNMPTIKHIYVGNIEYISNNHKVLPLQIKINGNVLEAKSRGIKFDQNTTLEAFKSIFPHLDRDTDFWVDDETGLLTAGVYYSQNIDEGRWFFAFKDGKLYSIELWWELC